MIGLYWPLVSRAVQIHLALLMGLLCCNIALAAGKVSPAYAKFFENEIRPLLVEHCFECHNEDEASGDLRLDSRAWMIAGGESGEAIVPSEPENSLLIEAIHYDSVEMPPSEKLSDEQIASLTKWVAIGAPWPGEDPNVPIKKRAVFDEEDRQWWAIQPVRSLAPPVLNSSLADWPRGGVDQFIAERMFSAGLTPAPPASKVTIVRRVYLDVTGLPPTPEQVAEFLHDDSDHAYDRLIDRLLGSEGYGEHAARQWLDLVRYADSDGYRADGYRPHAWRYRDYVIGSFNEDKPYDRFVQEQIAGDELFPENMDAQVALGYLRHWVYEWNIRDARTQWKTILDDVTDTTADVFLGLGLQCAKCHNHKFDPLLQKDYFRLQAFLTPIMPQEVAVANAKQQKQHQDKLAVWEQATSDLRDQIEDLKQPYKEKYRNVAIDRFPDDLVSIARKPAAERTPHEEQLAYLVQRQVLHEYDRLTPHLSKEDKETLIELQLQMKKHDAIKPASLPLAMVVSDVGIVAPMTVMPKRSSVIVEPGAPTILDPEAMTIEPSPSGLTTGRRSALARWLTDPKNPLSTRVIVNRVWQSHFGRGLAENPSDFGRLGGPPSHPELLDWLTTKFIQSRWSLKSLHRTMLLSATYRQSTAHPKFDAYHQIDPANEFYWRRDTSRLSAEQIRDALLLVSGELKACDGGSGKLADSRCRTIYTRVMRNSPDQLLNSFDLPQFFSSNSKRNTTTTPVQSLLMINSDLMLGYARKLAAQVRRDSDDTSEHVARAWQRVYGRPPTTAEVDQSLRFIQTQRDEIEHSKSRVATGLVETAKLPYRDGQAVKFDMDDSSLQLSVPHDARMNTGEFTIEAFFQLRSIAKTGAVRTIVGKWNGKNDSPGWRFGVTGAGSRRKPKTLVLQMVGNKAGTKLEETAIFSDQRIEINTPYYASAVFRLPDHTESGEAETGSVTFYLNDLSNDDEALLVARKPHDITGGWNNTVALTLGACGGKDRQAFDGLVDDIRLLGKALKADEILHAVQREQPSTIGYWQFETVPGVMKNSVMKTGVAQDGVTQDGQKQGDANGRLDIVGRGKAIVDLSPDEAALADFCHALLNSNEFLYQH